MDLRGIGLGGGGLDSTGSGQGPVAGCCECGDEPSGSCTTELVNGQFPRSLYEGLIDKEQSYRWLRFGDIKGETESVIMATQDQAISTNYFKKKFWNKKLKVNADCAKNMKRLLTT
jgi:hypothetical protein